MELKTPEQNLTSVFAYLGMPDQSGMLNGEKDYFSYLGYAMNQLSMAGELLSAGRKDISLLMLLDLKEHYGILRSQLLPIMGISSETIFRTEVGEPIDASTLAQYSVHLLRKDMAVLEDKLRLSKDDSNINKTM
ncbi:hypothetical protein COV19_02575 [Candidatus Woesearchaeota archaeon CG10_big_fil_rev_8_21_14_0_10_44_13]|nr:MAG: hypothetical protein COV19_02575 [Candidatus Woesearchaeota archaeon CG10_big_fil_rev_8_21_14_0_10_44_13]